ncbi:MAG: hypothetical protein PVH61_20670 [Candidatus Aminicenantes bacterium]|jgi:hypothetical protein
MKIKYLMIFIIVVCTWLEASTDSVIRVKAVGLASPGISLRTRARAAAFRAAKVEGYRKLAEAAGLAKIFQSGKYNYKEVNAFLKGVRVVSKRYISDYKVEVVMEMKKTDIYHSTISQLKKEIKTIEIHISTLNVRLEKLKEILKTLEEKVK